jgi:hypothetical protein
MAAVSKDARCPPSESGFSCPASSLSPPDAQRWAEMTRKREAQAVNVKLLPVPESTSFSGISLPARSTKF